MKLTVEYHAHRNKKRKTKISIARFFNFKSLICNCNMQVFAINKRKYVNTTVSAFLRFH